MKINWKKFTKKFTEVHDKNGSAVLLLDPHSVKGEEIVNLSKENFILEIEGKELNEKKVRKFLWENRKKRALQRKNALLWSSYMEDEDKSYVGVGATTSKEVADRLDYLNV